MCEFQMTIHFVNSRDHAEDLVVARKAHSKILPCQKINPVWVRQRGLLQPQLLTPFLKPCPLRFELLNLVA